MTTAPTKPSLATLPPELLLTIISHISSTPTLAALALTNHHLHRLTLPSLYHTFPGLNPTLFLRTIAHHPHLAAHTKELAWRPTGRTPPSLTPHEKQHILTRLSTLCDPHPSDLATRFQRFETSDDYWSFEILVLFCPRVERVRVSEAWMWDDHHYWFKPQSLVFNALSLCALLSATIQGPLRIENVAPLISIPTLKVLELSQVTVLRREGFRVFQWRVWPVDKVVPRGSSGLEVLVLRESYVYLESLAAVLGGVKALKSFVYEHLANELTEGSMDTFPVEVDEVASCLAGQSNSLEHLRIRDRQYVMDVVGVRAMLCGGDSEGAEARFSCLKTLDVGPLFTDDIVSLDEMEDVIRGLVKVLPASLQVLRLQMYCSVWRHMDLDCRVEQLLTCLARALADAERFLRVEVVECNPTLGWFPDTLPMLQRVYAGLGMDLLSTGRDAIEIYGAEPLLMDDEREEGWVVVTDLHLAVQR